MVLKTKLASKTESKRPDDPYSVNTVLDNFFSSQKPLFSLSEQVWNPPTDVYETKTAIVIVIEISGMRKEDISINLKGKSLIVSGFRGEETPEQKENIHLLEVHYGKFQRVFLFPSRVKFGNIEAVYKEGFLRICVPKRSVAKKTVTVTIE